MFTTWILELWSEESEFAPMPLFNCQVERREGIITGELLETGIAVVGKDCRIQRF